MNQRLAALAEAVVVGLAFALRVTGLTFQSLWRDEVDSLRFASQPLGGLLRSFVIPGQNGPLYYLLLKPWADIAGTSEFSLRFLSALAGVLAVPLVYRLTLRILPRRRSVGLLASLLVAMTPYLVWYGQEARMYAAVVCVVLGSMLGFLTAIQKGGWRHWASYALLTAAAIYLHFAAALVVPAQLGILVILKTDEAHGGWRRYLMALGALLILYLPLLAWQLPRLIQPPSTGYAFVPLDEMLTSLAVSYTSGVLARYAVWSLAPSLCLVSAALLFASRDGMMRPVIALVVWLSLPVAGFFLLTLFQPMFTARYLIFVQPALQILVAIGVWVVGRRSRWLAAAFVSALLIANLVALQQQATTPLKADFRGATRYITSRMTSEDRLLFEIPYGKYSFEYYAGRIAATPSRKAAPGEIRLFIPMVSGLGRSGYWLDGPYTNGGMSPSQVDAIMPQLVGGGQVVWFIATEVEMWDQRGMVQHWLDTHGSVTSRAEFTRVVVSRYVLP